MSSLWETMIDKRLYGSGFLFRSLPFALIILVIQSYVFILFSPHMLPTYVFLFALIIALSGLPAKNVRRDFHPMDWWLAYLFMVVSILGMGFAFGIKVETTLLSYLQAFLALILPQAAIVVSFMTIVVIGQRMSLRTSLGLRDNAFDKAKRKWQQELSAFPNLEKILDNLYEGRFAAGLFDKGFFNFAILWSCNVMEKIVDVVVAEVVSQTLERTSLFRYEGGRRRPYPEQLNNLGYGREETQKKILWRVWDVRNEIAHRNYRPSFNETAETLRTLISFTEEMPTILKSWGPKATG